MAKSARIDMRLAEDDDYLIRKAAAVSGTSVTAFVLASAKAEAAHVLADRTVFVLDEDQSAELDKRLSSIPKVKKRLRKLADAPELFS